VPSLLHCRSLTITGPAHFPPGTVLEGDVKWSGALASAGAFESGSEEAHAG